MSLRRLVLALLLLPLSATAALPLAWTQRLQALAEQAARAALPATAQVVVEVGAPDPRLRLAPCAEVQPFVPPGQSLWGRSRLGLRCTQGPGRWQITVPAQVRVIAPAWVATAPLPAGTVLRAEHLAWQNAEISSETAPVVGASAPLGRVLAQPIQNGVALRQPHLRARQWFAAGDPVTVLWRGAGFELKTEGQALAAGLEGQGVRVRVGEGRVIQALPVGERRVELGS